MNTAFNAELSDDWYAVLEEELQKPYISDLAAFLDTQRQHGGVVYPPQELLFSAFNHCSPAHTKVVILGQDPYHGPDQAHGLSFSVPLGQRVPPSLANIYKELQTDIGLSKPDNGNLASWATQGVFLLNSVLTVSAGQAGSHQKQGWETFTDAVIHTINQRCPHVVFMLWGSYAQKKAGFVDLDKHLVLQAPHPSPLSAHRGFLGCRHFSQANNWLCKRGLSPVDWEIPADANAEAVVKQGALF